ncbi:MAG TPA: hypothetical protein VK656_05980, partial [Candidatus Acidoferrum sp.]|nr:hypothetical protein [Candidatus Acidoferrum sp.]
MRRAGPFIIVIVGVLALLVDFLPNLKVPVIGDTTGTSPTRVLEWKLGLDLQGGFRVEYQAQPNGTVAPNAGDMSTIRDIIERRVNSTGVSEPVVQTQGADRIVVELPGVQDSAAIEALVGKTGRLDFIPLPVATYGNTASNSNGGARGVTDGS